MKIKRLRRYYYYYYVASVVSDFVRPHRWQPTRLPRPWDSQGKNTGVGCHFLLQCMKVKSLSSCPILSDPMDCSLPGSSVHGIFQARVLEWVPSPSLRKYPNIFNFASSILGTHGFPRKDMGGKTERLGILHILGNIQMVLSGLRNQNRASRNQA